MKTRVLSFGFLVLSWLSILCVPAVGCPPDPPPPPPCCSGGCTGCSMYCIDCLCQCMIGVGPWADEVSGCVGYELTFIGGGQACCDQVVWSGGDAPHSNGCSFSTHWDTPGSYTVTAITPCSTLSGEVIIVKVGKVVEAGTDNEGPLYVCLNSNAGLEAKPYPPGSGWLCNVNWSIVSRPPDSHPSVTPHPVYSYKATLSGLDKRGDYVVKATSGCNGHECPGDTITVSVESPLVNESTYGAYCPTWGTSPSSCPPGPCDGEDSYELDGCFNELEVSCCQSDGSGGALGCAIRVFYNNSPKSSCVFAIEPENEVYRKIATIDGTEKKVFTKIKHINEKRNKYIEGCWGYYCTKFYFYDCITGASNTIWRRRADCQPLNEQDGEKCPGH